MSRCKRWGCQHLCCAGLCASSAGFSECSLWPQRAGHVGEQSHAKALCKGLGLENLLQTKSGTLFFLW